MATLTLKAYSGAYPSITNRLEAAIAYASSPLAIVANIIEISPHNIRTWQFDGLPRNNYRFYLWEIDGSGNVVNILADFDVVPGELSGELVRDDEQIQVGIEPGLIAGNTSFTFDGSETSMGSGIFKKDYRGWEITIDECTGRDIMIRGVDYSWDKISGIFSLLQTGDVLANAQWYNIHFNSQINSQGSSYPTLTDFNIRLSKPTLNDSILLSDFGNKVIVEPQSSYVELNLPDINTVVDGRKCTLEMTKGTIQCAKFIPYLSQPINWLNGNIYLYPTESLSIYAFTRPVTLVKEWRVCEADGNFRYVGQTVSDDTISPNLFNKHLLDGSIEFINQYSRIYYEYVLKLPISQVVSFSNWLVGNNKYYFSLDSGSGQFHFPDRRGVFEKSNLGGKSGDYSDDQVGQFTDNLIIPKTSTSQEDTGVGKFTTGGGANEPTDMLPVEITWNTGKETYPKNYLINKYVLV